MFTLSSHNLLLTIFAGLTLCPDLWAHGSSDNLTDIGRNANSSLISFPGNDSDYSTVDGSTPDKEYEDLLAPDSETSFKVPQDPDEFMNYFEDLIKTVQVKLEDVFDQYLPRLFEMSSSVTLSPDCTYDVVRVLFGLREMKPWAIKLLDSSGKLPDGILYGTFSSLGAYDECLELKLSDDGKEATPAVTGQYCSVSIRPFLPPKPPFSTLNKVFNDAADAKGYPKKDHFSRIVPIFYYLKFRLGLCIPSSCSTKDLKSITNTLSTRIRLNVSVGDCEVKESVDMTREQVVAGSVLGTVLCLVLLATVIDVIRRLFSWQELKSSRITSLLGRCWLSFSAYTNSTNLLNTEVPLDAVRPLYGLKVLSLVWVILAHAYLTLDLKAVGHLFRTREVNQDFLFQMVMNASLAVETFFFISGLLVTFVAMKRLKSNPKMTLSQWTWFYVHRICRITPAVVLVIAIVLAAYQWSDGPLWREIIYPSAERCRENWWIHFLHISNFFDVSRMCFLHLWYIAADMQLFLCTPFLIALLFKKPATGRCVLYFLTLASVVSTGVVTFLDSLPPTLIFDNPDPMSRKPFGNLVLVKPYPHAAPYMVGMLTGYVLHGNPRLKLNKITTIVGWVSSMAVSAVAIFITWEWNKGSVPSPWVSAIYAALFRYMWALAMAWIVMACHLGRGGIINTILSYKLFVPLSRLSYTAYLIHPGLMYIFVASTRNLFMFSHYLVMYLFLSHLVATFAASFALSLVIEIPFVVLEKVLFTHFWSSGHSKRKRFYYSVNPMKPSICDPKGSLAKDSGADTGPSPDPGPRIPPLPLPLTEKYSITSVDSRSFLMDNGFTFSDNSNPVYDCRL